MTNNNRPQNSFNKKNPNYNNNLIITNTKNTKKLRTKNNSINMLNNPIMQPLLKYYFEMLLKNLIKQQLIQIFSIKGSKYIANNIFKLINKQHKNFYK
ncbi:hypothetical protein SAMN02745883_01104 [Caminicella sporogenes DSM 14501]|uniref:Uncharacterized protein n=1 Tax=Caminicella sporogenes DSM 14501 TaxID=1121266 RepID=A0A1M6P4H1_9FIRM|nr:hypothetical protein BET04_07330 [Caminicella sporogenes]SHK02869.1 hypothetical protein SAMN02745883_01104 [Caminicella sporogenes DSM 14501]